MAATLSALGAGCALFETGGWTAATSDVDRQTLLKPIVEAAPEALRLEYVILERPAGDPLLGGELWDELVEIGLFDQAVRESLNRHGFRVGVTSSSPPQAMQKLLGEADEILDGSTPEGARKRRGQLLVLPSGGQTEAQTSDLIASCTVDVAVDGEIKEKTFENARGVFRVTASSKQAGWATFEFLPEIHHGFAGTRPVAGQAGWQQFETGQNVQKLYAQRFTLTLNEGDAAVITSLGDDADRAGRLFFRTEADGVPVQRLLVVRLLRTGETPVRK
ncbi:MAG TPA: hypothetical protein VF170_18705 [Planctomycetaceae bacterium]